MSEIAKALVAFQAALPHIGKDNTAQVKSDKGSYSYDYADLTTISEAAFPLLAGHGLSFVCGPTMTEHGFVLHYELLHTSGESRAGDYPLPDPARCSPQQIGSAITYGRRYCLTAVTGIAPGGEDDDGKRAEDARAQRPQQERLADAAWLDDISTRIDLASNQMELVAIETECKRAFNTGTMPGEDAKRLRGLIDNRKAELSAPVGAS